MKYIISTEFVGRHRRSSMCLDPGRGCLCLSKKTGMNWSGHVEDNTSHGF